MKEFCGEIAYDGENGGVHSDICWHEKDDQKAISDNYRKFLHDCLDEWLNKSNGTGAFWLGDYKYFDNWFDGTQIGVDE